ncbi:hypothetical protein IYY11_02645 [Methylocystis sp. H62]|uniref:hypothetical protein n=1 Tax=Methylocystis sp. H62 TaxID=2785789 RepID=UPI0018C2904D|nr:hypothetical protein [Methylocystis sp. H62]MBG0792353.1 hypothetical protein [Methylocystis sp. H62]
MIEELSKVDSWRALPPPGANLLVALRKLPEAQSRIALHPLGALQISQRFAPLDAKIDRVGAQKPSDGKRFSLSAASAAFVKRRDVDERFAPAQFEDLSDNERLSRKAFEPRHGGVELSAAGAQLESGAAIVRVARYDLITIDTNARSHRFRFAVLAKVFFNRLFAGAAVARSPLSMKSRKTRVPVEDGVKEKSEGFAVALQENNRSFKADSAYFASEGAAREWMQSAVAKDRNLADRLHVLPHFELAA